MATPEQIPTDLTLDLGDDLAPEDFVAAARSFFGYIAEITDAQRGDGVEIAWVVRVKEGSSLIGLEPNASAPTSRLGMIYAKAKFGLEAIERGEIKKAGLSEKAVGCLKNLSDISDRNPGGRGINLWVRREPINIGAGISRRVLEDMESDYYDYGTIEGRLEAIQDANGALKIRVKDFLFPKAINCIVPEKMIDQVFASFRRRVEIEGRIHYRRDGSPLSIEAETIDILPEDDELPTAADVRGIMAPA